MRGLYHTPWSDEVDLLTFADNQDSEGYGVEPAQRRTLFCNWEEGVSQNEFYLSNKQGLQATDSVELQRADYEGERFAEYQGRRYRVIRSFPASFDTITLILSEVVR